MTETNDEAWTRVELSFYLPQGYTDTWYVNTPDRGLALRSALVHYGKERMAYMNYAAMVTGPRPDEAILHRCWCPLLDTE